MEEVLLPLCQYQTADAKEYKWQSDNNQQLCRTNICHDSIIKSIS